MKDLDKDKKYYIKNLDKTQKEELLRWLIKNCIGWNVFLLHVTTVVKYNNCRKEWLSVINDDNAPDYVDAKVLFEINNKIE